MNRIEIASAEAPQAIGAYSQGVRMGDLVFLTAQIGLSPTTGQLAGSFTEQVEQMLSNLAAVAEAAGGSLNDVGKLTIYLTDLRQAGEVNSALARHFQAPFPARASVGVQQLALDALVAIDATLVLGRALTDSTAR